jgi:hypothetical protein
MLFLTGHSVEQRWRDQYSNEGTTAEQNDR